MGAAVVEIGDEGEEGQDEERRKLNYERGGQKGCSEEGRELIRMIREKKERKEGRKRERERKIVGINKRKEMKLNGKKKKECKK